VDGMLESFPFLCARAELIARQAPELITAAGIDADDFRAKIKAVRKVRNVCQYEFLPTCASRF
jgi:hypothetical protein